MLYTVKGNSYLQDLAEVFKARNFPFSFKEENLLEVEVEVEQVEEYQLILAFAISYNAFQKIIKEELKRRKIEEDLANSFYYEACKYFQNSKYWIGLSKVWVADFLETRTMINADTFAMFNMKGFKQEIKDYVDNLLNHAKDHEQMGTSNMAEVPVINIEEVFSIMREHVEKSELVLSDYEVLHVFENGEGFAIEDKEGTIIDEEFFITNVGIMLQVGIQDDDGNQAVKDAMSLMCMCHIFEPNKVIVHSGLTEEAEKSVRQNEVLMNKQPSKPIEFVYCDGCENCDEK